MAAPGILLDQSRFNCSICLDLMLDPVTVPCGHSYCMRCIEAHLNQEDHLKLYSCPQCRQTFAPRPALLKNTMLEFVVQELRKAELPKSSPPRLLLTPPPAFDSHCPEADDVSCDFCEEKAFKSCLQCLASYCELHLQPHYEVAPLKKHKLGEPSSKIQESVCPRHQEVMKLFCRTDQRCICYLCSKDEHRGHDKVSAAAERPEKQKELETSRRNLLQRIQDKERDQKMFKQEEDAVNHSAQKALQDTEKIFTELMRVLEKRYSDVQEKIEARQKIEVGRYQTVQGRLEQEVAQLRRQEADLQKLLRTQDHTYFLMNFPSKARPGTLKDPPTVRIRRLRYFEKVSVALLEARDALLLALAEEYAKITMTVTEPKVLKQNLNADPKTRSDFLRFACKLTLDPNTANAHLAVTKGDMKVAFVPEEQKCPSHPERFAFSWQVLSREGLTGRSYWEVERSGRGVLLAMAYRDIGRTGQFADCVFGQNGKSWALDCYKNSYEFHHNNVKTAIPGVWSSRVGVYLDQGAGLLSFYSVSDTMTLLHRVQSRFTKPLHAGIWLSEGAAAELCKLK